MGCWVRIFNVKLPLRMSNIIPGYVGDTKIHVGSRFEHLMANHPYKLSAKDISYTLPFILASPSNVPIRGAVVENVGNCFYGLNKKCILPRTANAADGVTL